MRREGWGLGPRGHTDGYHLPWARHRQYFTRPACLIFTQPSRAGPIIIPILHMRKLTARAVR